MGDHQIISVFLEGNVNLWFESNNTLPIYSHVFLAVVTVTLQSCGVISIKMVMQLSASRHLVD
jgi:hypothetical protein